MGYRNRERVARSRTFERGNKVSERMDLRRKWRVQLQLEKNKDREGKLRVRKIWMLYQEAGWKDRVVKGYHVHIPSVDEGRHKAESQV